MEIKNNTQMENKNNNMITRIVLITTLLLALVAASFGAADKLFVRKDVFAAHQAMTSNQLDNINKQLDGISKKLDRIGDRYEQRQR